MQRILSFAKIRPVEMYVRIKQYDSSPWILISGRGERTIGSNEFKKQRLQLLVTSATKMYAKQNNEHDCLDYG